MSAGKWIALTVICTGLSSLKTALAEGPDVIVADLPVTTDYSRNAETAALSVATTSCNAGDTFLQWQALPSNQHPVIAQNMYRLKNDRLEQIGQAWVKHGFLATNNGICGVCDGNLGSVLGVGCSDPYGAGLNAGPFLGARSKINPVTGYFDAATADVHTGHLHSDIAHGLQVKHADLGNAGARYFVEGQYVAADDAQAGNGNNNTSYREISVSGDSSNWVFTNVGPTQQEMPAIFSWDGASFAIIDSWPQDGRLIVAHKARELGGDQYRYEYAVYNMNSERAVRSFTVPIGSANISNVGFHAAPNHDEGYVDDPSNAPWISYIDSASLTWITDSFPDNPNANAIRWGTMHNFWFDADVAPVGSTARMRRFKPGDGPDTAFAQLVAPGRIDCDGSGVPDDDEIAADPSLDCNSDGVMDACQLDGNDCNGNGIPDDCDLENLDCDDNGIVDTCDLDGNDCNGNMIIDACESAGDCNENGIFDVCDALGNDCNANEIPDDCENDCDRNGTIDACEAQPDCNTNDIPDDCDVTTIPGGSHDYPSGLLFITFGPNNISHSIEVSDGGLIADVNVSVDIRHPWVSDIIMRIEHNGTEVLLWNQDCGAADHILATFDDEGSPRVCGAPTTGIITPTSTGGGMLSAFDGQDPFGTWTLSIEDAFPGQSNGFLREWSFHVEANDDPATSEDVNGNGIPDECECPTCLGDMNGDGGVDAADIQSFVNACVGLEIANGCADMDASGLPLTMTDVDGFVSELLNAGPCSGP
ncbi:MAG: proprotein convertase P-domain-containing protein [Phycisphaerales bacterium]|nr:proprotein convertase P-domain-containing protein [Phycisphaerales bacterium]